MTIHNKQAYMDALWDWGFLDECFGPTKIRVSDVDGIVERDGHLLIIEAKPLGKEVSKGQWRLFRELALSGHTVLIIWGSAANQPEEAQIWVHHQQSPNPKWKATEENIKSFVSRWFIWANQIGPKSMLDALDKPWPGTLEFREGELWSKTGY